MTRSGPKDDANTYRKKLHASKEASAVLFELFKGSAQYSHPLLAWLRIFDKNMDLCVTYEEFCEGAYHLNYKGDPTALLHKLDIDGSGEVMLEEIDPVSAKLWMKFRMWCAARFDDPKDMLFKLQNGQGNHAQHVCAKVDFIDGLHRLEWRGGNEDLLFECLDRDNDDVISLAYLSWFVKDKQKQLRKENARRFIEKQTARNAKEHKEVARQLEDFQAYLKKKFTTCLRAWLSVIDQDGSMTIQKPELFKAVKDIGWEGNTKLLWKGMDKDGSGFTSLQELDLRDAERLAKFKEFTRIKFGSAIQAFQVFDLQKKGKLKEEEFIEACRKHGFSRMDARLFRGLDWQRNKSIRSENIAFLDTWRCPAYLTCQANEQAAQDFKTCLIKEFKNFVKAWRSCLDRNNTNQVDWEEFQAAAKRIRFAGDLPGAWRALDDDVSGFISLHEIDHDASKVISEFKCWADEEFGGSRKAFKVFDHNDSFELSVREWRKACMAFAYPGDSRAFFDALDSDRSGVLTLNEIAFIDSWELTAAQLAEVYPEGKPREEAVVKPIKPVIEPSPRLLRLALPKNRRRPVGGGNDQASRCPSKSTTSPHMPKLELNSDRPVWSPESDPGFWMEFCGLRPDTPLKPITPPPRAHVNPAVLSHIGTLKSLILQQPITQQPKEAWVGSEDASLDFVSIREKTVSLRNRTVSLLEKVERVEQEFGSPLVSSAKSPLGSAKPSMTSISRLFSKNENSINSF
jgi:Ca2+-binding EF-hand superfamily protein